MDGTTETLFFFLGLRRHGQSGTWSQAVKVRSEDMLTALHLGREGYRNGVAFTAQAATLCYQLKLSESKKSFLRCF